MKINFKKVFILGCISLGILMFTIAIFDMTERENSINENKFETIGKIYKFSSNRSFDHYYFKYNYKEKEYSNYQNIHDFEGDKCIGKFYKVNLSTKNPEYSIIFIDQEVTDKSEIIKAGFLVKD